MILSHLWAVHLKASKGLHIKSTIKSTAKGSEGDSKYPRRAPKDAPTDEGMILGPKIEGVTSKIMGTWIRLVLFLKVYLLV